jgi:hypothetical protein
MKKYTLQIPKAVERQLLRCRVSIKQSIAEKLRVILETVAAAPTSRPRTSRQAPGAQGPPLRFYVYEGYRVSYLVNVVTRTVVVLKLQPASG